MMHQNDDSKNADDTREERRTTTVNELREEVRSLRQIISNFETYNDSIRKALIDIAIALEKISNVEHELHKQKSETSYQEKKLNSIFNRLPVIEQTISWVNRGIISLIGVLGLILLTQFFNNGGFGQ